MRNCSGGDKHANDRRHYSRCEERAHSSSSELQLEAFDPMVGVAARGVGASVEQRIALAHCGGGGPQARAPHMMWAGDPVCATVTQADPQLTRRCGVICTGPGGGRIVALAWTSEREALPFRSDK